MNTEKLYTVVNEVMVFHNGNVILDVTTEEEPYVHIRNVQEVVVTHMVLEVPETKHICFTVAYHITTSRKIVASCNDNTVVIQKGKK